MTLEDQIMQSPPVLSREPFIPRDIRETVQISCDYAREVLTRLVHEGRLVRLENGKYSALPRSRYWLTRKWTAGKWGAPGFGPLEWR